jgi:hypothetical protein
VNAATVVQAPWRATPRWVRWYVGVLLAAAAIGAVLIGIFMQRAAWPLAAAAVLAIGAFFTGMFLLAPSLLLAIDARQLRIPGLQRATVLGILLPASVAIALPTTLLALAGGDPADIASMLAMALCGGLLLGLVPSVLCAMVGLVPMALRTLRLQLDLPGPGEPGFALLGIAATLAMLAACALCWRRQLRATDPYQPGWSRPMVMQFRRASRSSGWAGLSGGMADTVQQLRQQPDWLQATVALGPSGPRHRRYSLRVALGGIFVPMSLAGYARQLAFCLLPGTLVLAMLLVQAAGRHGGFSWLLLAQWTGLFAWVGGFVSLLVALIGAVQLSQRWQKDNAELPLLALLPGLGTPAQLRRDLLGASLLPGLIVQCAMLAVLIAMVLAARLGWLAGLAALLVQLTGMGMLVAFTLMIVGGRPLPAWGTGILCTLCFLQMSLALSWLLLDRNAFERAHGIPAALLGVSWIAVLPVLAWLGRRGWHGLRQRPHPFLSNGH